MSDRNDDPPPPPPDEPQPSSPFPESSLTPSPAPDSPPAQEAPPPPAQEATPPRQWMETPAPGGLAGGDPLAGTAPPAPPAYPPGYTSPPPPGAGGHAMPPAPASPSVAAPAPGTHVLAGWWRRVGAAVVDGILVLLIASAFAFIVGASLFSADESGVLGLILGILVFVLFLGLGTLVYAPVMMGRTNGRTIGRMATGIRVIRADGRPMTIGFAAVREVAVKWLLVGVISALTVGLVWLVDVLWPLWDDENRALHDFVVNTRTVIDS